MRFDGQLKSWNPERGFGFIEPVGGGQEIFVHLSAVPTRFRPPKIGQRLSFEVELSPQGKKRAANVGVVAAPPLSRVPRREEPAPWSVGSALAVPAFVVVYVAMAATRSVSWWFAFGYVSLSIVCLMAYALDKSAAVAGRWRSPERRLLILGLAGGWPGGLLAQHLLRHKSNKASFRNQFCCSALLNVTAFVGYHLLLHLISHA